MRWALKGHFSKGHVVTDEHSFQLTGEGQKRSGKEVWYWGSIISINPLGRSFCHGKGLDHIITRVNKAKNSIIYADVKIVKEGNPKRNLGEVLQPLAPGQGKCWKDKCDFGRRRKERFSFRSRVKLRHRHIDIPSSSVRTNIGRLSGPWPMSVWAATVTEYRVPFFRPSIRYRKQLDGMSEIFCTGSFSRSTATYRMEYPVMIPFSSVTGGAQLSSRLVEEGLMHVTSWGRGMDSDWVVRELGGFNCVCWSNGG